MNQEAPDKKKQVIGLYGEMCLAMELHDRGWQVHRSYIDEGIDFVISQYYCEQCGKYTTQHIRKSQYAGKQVKCVTNLCFRCKNEIKIVTKNIQVKTSEGISSEKKGMKKFSFHPKIRYNLGKNVFYIKSYTNK